MDLNECGVIGRRSASSGKIAGDGVGGSFAVHAIHIRRVPAAFLHRNTAPRNILRYPARQYGGAIGALDLYRLPVLNTARDGVIRMHPNVVRVDPIQFFLIAVDRVRPSPGFRAEQAEWVIFARIDMRHPFWDGGNLAKTCLLYTSPSPRD